MTGRSTGAGTAGRRGVRGSAALTLLILAVLVGCGSDDGSSAGPSAQVTAESSSDGVAGTSRQDVETDEGTERRLAGLPVGLFPLGEDGCLGVNVTLSADQRASLTQVDLAGNVVRRDGGCGEQPECPGGPVDLDEGSQTCSMTVASPGGQAQARLHLRISCDDAGGWCPAGGLRDARVFADTPVTDVASTEAGGNEAPSGSDQSPSGADESPSGGNQTAESSEDPSTPTSG